MGSFTSPPCGENVVWFVHDKPIPVGETVVDFLKKAFQPVEPTLGDTYTNMDGSYREE